MVLNVTKKEERAKERQLLVNTFPETGMVRIKSMAAFLNISESAAWAYVAQGRIRKPIKLSPRTSVWKAEYVRDELATNGIPEAVEGAK